MQFFRKQSLREIAQNMDKTAASSDALPPKGNMRPDEYFQATFNKVYNVPSSNISVQGSIMDFNPPGAPTYESTLKGSIKDTPQHQLWYRYKYGDRSHQPKDPRIRGELLGTFALLMRKIEAEAIRKKSPPGETSKKARKNLFNAFDRYDPTFGVTLANYVFSQIYPNGPNSASVVTREVVKYQQLKSLPAKDAKLLGPYRNFASEFEQLRGRKPTTSEVAKELNISQAHAKRFMFNTAPEYALENQVDENAVFKDHSLREKDAIRTIYRDQDEQNKRIMRHMFSDILGGEKPPMPLHAGGYGWIAKKVGIPPYTMSRRKDSILKKINSLL